jgi:2-oxoisovalerate dehydrogenase E1 component alpha subunit
MKISQSSPVATQIPHSVGAALALKMDKKPNIATATVGEGSSNQGDFHEGLNFAGVHKSLSDSCRSNIWFFIHF